MHLVVRSLLSYLFLVSVLATSSYASSKIEMEDANEASQSFARVAAPFLKQAQEFIGKKNQTESRAVLRQLNALFCVEGTRPATKQDYELFYAVNLLNATYLNSHVAGDEASLKNGLEALLSKARSTTTTNAKNLITCTLHFAANPSYGVSLKHGLFGSVPSFTKELLEWGERLIAQRYEEQRKRTASLTVLTESERKELERLDAIEKEQDLKQLLLQKAPPKELQDTYKAYDKQKAMTSHDMDVHRFNAVIGFKDILPVVLKYDTVSKANLSFDAVANAIQAACPEKDIKTLGANLAQLKSHIAGSAIEGGETGANVGQLLSRLWSLSENHPARISSIITVLCDNSQTGGGCYPGHAGRFSDLYVKYARDLWLWG